jgi:hypothetical protein
MFCQVAKSPVDAARPTQPAIEDLGFRTNIDTTGRLLDEEDVSTQREITAQKNLLLVATRQGPDRCGRRRSLDGQALDRVRDDVAVTSCRLQLKVLTVQTDGKVVSQ